MHQEDLLSLIMSWLLSVCRDLLLWYKEETYDYLKCPDAASNAP